MAAAAIWSFAYALEISSTDYASNLLTTDIEYFGIATIPVAWFLFAVEYTGRWRWLKRKNVTLLFVVPALTVLLVTTNEFHQLYYTEIIPNVVQGTVIWVFYYGPLFWIHILYSYLLVVAGSVLMVGQYVISKAYRTQVVLLFIAMLIPFATNAAYVLHIGPIVGLDLTPVAFLVTGVAITIAILKFELFSMMPVAHRLIIDHMVDGVLAVDPRGKVVDCNPAVANILGRPGGVIPGTPIESLIPEAGPLIAGCAGDQSTIEITLLQGNALRSFNVQCIPIRRGPTGAKGHIIVLHDITEQNRSNQALEQANRKLALLSSITRHDIINQLTALSGACELMKEKATDPETKHLISIGERATATIYRQIQFTREYQELGVKAPRWQNVRHEFLSAAKLLDLGNVSLEAGENNLEVYADPLLGKVFYNLIDNALRHAGYLSLIRLSHHASDEGMVIVVEDDGEGVPEKDKPRLFEKGFGKNTGYGLFLSREILSITGITIRETAGPGQGARFEIAVPDGEYRFRTGE